MDIVDAVILGIIQGITEFLPVSSSGHLILFQDWLQVGGLNNLAFDAVLHFATIAAVITYFWADVWGLLQVGLRKLGRLPVNKRDITLLYALVVGTIPAVVVGLLLESIIDEKLRNPLFVATMLFAAALFFLYAEWRSYLRPMHGALTVRQGLLVGLYQAVALLPGVSRSGSTIAGGMLLGLSRYEATRFSFLLAIPIILAAGSKKLVDLLGEQGVVDWGMIAVGSVVAYVMALIVIHFFLKFIRKYTLWPFVWYNIILAGMVGYVYFFT